MGAPFSDRPPVTGPRYVFSPAFTHAEAVRMLLAAGADPNALSVNRTPLDWALSKGHTEVVRVLAEGGTALDAPDWW
jgi:ankyrin repeat protein